MGVFFFEWQAPGDNHADESCHVVHIFEIVQIVFHSFDEEKFGFWGSFDCESFSKFSFEFLFLFVFAEVVEVGGHAQESGEAVGLEETHELEGFHFKANGDI